MSKDVPWYLVLAIGRLAEEEVLINGSRPMDTDLVSIRNQMKLGRASRGNNFHMSSLKLEIEVPGRS